MWKFLGIGKLSRICVEIDQKVKKCEREILSRTTALSYFVYLLFTAFVCLWLYWCLAAHWTCIIVLNVMWLMSDELSWSDEL